MISGIVLEKLPETQEIDGAKRWEEEKGEFAQIAFHEEARHVALFTLRKGFTRGNHYHLIKDEVFYVAAGTIDARFRDIGTGEEMNLMLGKGDKLRIRPGIWHLFYGMEDALVVEYSSQVYDKADTYSDR